MNYRMLYLLLALLTAGVAHAQDRNLMVSEPRVALVIGNSSYKDAPLRNPVNDATDIAATLRALGFAVTLRTNADTRQMRTVIREFAQNLKRGGVGLFYFAGHGIQSRNGKNYLIPVGADLREEFELEDEAVDANRILAGMEEAGNRVNIVILDACRNNPFARSWRSATNGLAQMGAPTGSFVAFATAPGSVAADGMGRNGIFTQHLLANLKAGDPDIDRVFTRVTAAVARETDKKQVPWKSSSLTGNFYFALAAPSTTRIDAPATAPADPRADDRALWEAVKDSSSAGDLQAYLDQFPNGIYAGVARSRIRTLTMAKPPVQVATAPPSTLSVKPAPAVSAGATTDFSPGSTFRDCDSCPEMVVIPAGSFTMGSPDSEQGRFDNEGPQHAVNIASALAVGKHEVTRGEYAQFVRETSRSSSGCYAFKDGKFQNDASANWQAPGFAQNDSHPVVCVDWNDAKAYAAWLSRKSGKNYRLLSEAEWEYAARAGTSTAYYWGDSASNACQYANGADQTAMTASIGSTTTNLNCADNHVYTAPVGSFQANAFGLHDMTGNAWEWTEDCWNGNYNGALSQGSASTAGECGQRVLRGGSGVNLARYLRSAVRSWNSVSSRLFNRGFRVARTL